MWRQSKISGTFLLMLWYCVPRFSNSTYTLIAVQLEADLLSLLHDNIARLDEENESDRAGVYHVLSTLLGSS